MASWAGGGSRKEFAENLIDKGKEDWNKWTAPQAKGFITYDFKGKSLDLNGVEFVSANQRNKWPTKVTIYKKKDTDRGVECTHPLVQFKLNF